LNVCLNSISKQIFDKNFHCLIADDCSNDRSHKIIESFLQNYPKLFSYIKRQDNLGKFTGGNGRLNGLHAYSLVKSKYVAVCDGDDYWTDPYKLQKQVDYLETNPVCSICTHWVKTIDESGQGIHEDALTIPKLKEDMHASDLFNLNLNTKPILGAAYHPSSWVFRQSLVAEIPSWNVKIVGGDDVLFTTFLRFGFCHRISEYMSTYRINKASSWSPLDVHQKGVNNLQFLLNVKKHYQEYTSPIIKCLGWLQQKYLDWPLNNKELSQIIRISLKTAFKDKVIALDLVKFFVPVWFHHQSNRVLSYMRVFAGKIKQLSPIR
jgi:glycosyltransferase involved in cell wall biosynthesis